MLRAENNLAPSDTKYAFSVDLLKQMRIVRLIKTLQKQHAKKYSLESYVNTDMEEEAAQLFHKSEIELDQILETERDKLIEMQDNSWDIREGHHNDRITAAAIAENKDVATKIKELKEREKQRRTFDRLGSILKTRSYGNITRLGLPTEVQHETTDVIWTYIQSKTQQEMKKVQWMYIEDQAQIERRLVEWNILHFNQASETPLANENYKNKLDPCDKTDSELEHILKHKLSEGHDERPEVKFFLQQIQQNIQTPMPKEKTNLTEAQFRDFYRKTPEDKSASPSGLHLGHYKAASTNSDFSWVLWKILTLAYTNSYCLHRWKISATTLLEKIHGYPWIHKFRTIHIVESDLNYIMRAIWGREFMYYNEDNETLHDNQYGGRKGRQPQSAVLNKVLTLDIIRHYGEDASLVDNDAKACYDRIIPYLTTYMLRRLGMPFFLTRFMCNVLRQMQYSIRMPQGQSVKYDSSSKELYGTGQGAGWSPPCWAANSDIISCCIEKFAPGILLQHPNNITHSHRHLDVFVDDTSHGITRPAINKFVPSDDSPVIKDTIMRMQLQHNMSFYNSLLQLTGGALAWEKCKAYILEFIWNNGDKSMAPTKDTHPPLEIFDIFHDKFFQILLANPDEAFRMLGAFVAPDGNTTEQIKVLKKKVQAWADKIDHSYTTAHEVLTAFNQILFPAVIYPAAVIALTEHECDDIMKPALQSLLTKLNMPKNTSRLLLYGPSRYGGMNLPNLYVQSYFLKIMMIIGHLQKQDTTATILDIALGTAQQQVGITKPIL